MNARTIVSLAAATLFAASSFAAEPADELQELNQVLTQETALATQSKLNADFVPGMVTILQGTDMQALGCQTVLDALSLVPGIQTVREDFGSPNLVVRGVAYPFNAGNTKVMVDSIGLSRENAGNNSTALLTRIEQVERIEVIRGPSGSIHGAFAFAGVINIITKKTGSEAFIFGNSSDAQAIGGHHTFREKSGKWALSLNTGLAQGREEEGARGTKPHGSGSTSVLQLDRGRFSLIVEHLSRDQNFTPEGVPFTFNADERTLTVQAIERFPLSKTADSELRLTYLDNSFHTGSSGKEFFGDLQDATFDVHWRPTPKHNLLLRAQSIRDLTATGNLTLPPFPPPPLLFTRVKDHARRIEAASVQDQIDINDRLSLTLGLRVDDYSDVGSRATPRAGLVYRASPQDIVKVQYTQGFRPPTFFELFARGVPDDNLNFEVMSTGELGYIHKVKSSTARVTLFSSRINDMLFLVLPPPGPPPTFFDNSKITKMHGIEAEYEARFGPKWRLISNVSYTKTFDSRATSSSTFDSAGAADFMGNLATLYTPNHRMTFGARAYYISERHIFSGTTPGYTTLDLTGSFTDFPAKRWTFQTGVKNATDDRVTYVQALPNLSNVLQFEPRTAWARTSVSF